MNGFWLLLTVLVIVVAAIAHEPQDRRRGPHDYGFSRRELIAAIPAGILAAALFGVSVAAFLVLAPR